MVTSFDDFERAVAELGAQIEKVRRITREQGIDRSDEIASLESQMQRVLHDRYSQLTPWEKTRVARNPKRPFSLDYIRLMCQGFTELHGDRLFGDDGAIIGGPAQFGDRWVVVIGQQKGRDAAERQQRNFGYSRPEGYRKALRLMRMAEKFGRPVICLIDTPAADPGVPSEERGISGAIARNIHEMFLIKVPIVIAITGEGGSGGALGIGVGDRVLMLEHAVYSVIPPEGCAAILWKDSDRGSDAAVALRLTAESAREQGIVDEIVPEPIGGAHRDYDEAARTLSQAIGRVLDDLTLQPVEALLDARYARFRRLGKLLDSGAS